MRNIEFTLSTGWDTITAKPLYSDDIALVTERETNQIFFREKLSGKLTFLNDDYTWIMNTAFSQKITCNITITDNNNTKVWSGYFYRTDCTINEVDGILIVEPVPNDKYSAILDAMDNEVDLYENGVVMNGKNNLPGLIMVPPILQIYQLGSETVQNYLQGDLWQTDVAEATEDKSFLNSIGFDLSYGYMGATQDGDYELEYSPVSFSMSGDSVEINLTSGNYRLNIVYHDGGYVNVHFYRNGSFYAQGIGSVNDSSITLSRYEEQTQIVIGHVVLTCIEVWARIVTSFNSGMQDGAGWHYIGDFATPSKWYQYAQPLLANSLNIEFTMYNGKTTTPTKYGMIDDTGYYYSKPYSSTRDIIPVLQSQWTADFSFWLKIDRSSDSKLDTVWYSYNVPMMTLGNIIRCLLSANGINNITFQDTATYSQFLYTNPAPITNWDNDFCIWFTPKSNITNGKSTQFATKAPCKLSTIFDFLKKALNVYWYIDDNNRLIIEHWNYFRKGKTYSGNIVTAYDLTNMYNVRNEKPWAFGQNEYKFEKYTIPEFLKWSWMDETSYFFDGTGITCIDDFITKGQTEESSISDITTDINFMVTQPDKCSMDGFAAIFAENHYGYWTRRTTKEVQDNSLSFYTQNSQLAMFELQKSVLQYNLPCSQINRSKLTVTIPQELVKRAKTNEVKFPAFDLDPFEHVKTNIGDGEVESIENKICNNMLKVKLKYETE